MENNLNKNLNKYGYNTNQMCTRCNLYNKGCNGHMREMYMKSINHFCPNFKDRNYTDEQARQHWHLEEFVKQFSN